MKLKFLILNCLLPPYEIRFYHFSSFIHSILIKEKMSKRNNNIHICIQKNIKHRITDLFDLMIKTEARRVKKKQTAKCQMQTIRNDRRQQTDLYVFCISHKLKIYLKFFLFFSYLISNC